MSEQRVASRYAKSILDLAQEKNVVEQIYQDMELFLKVCNENKQLQAVLKNPIIYSYKKLAILEAIFEDKMNPITRYFFEIISKKNRETALFAIAKEFMVQYEVFKNIQRIQVTTTFPLTQALREDFVQSAQENLGKTVKLEEKVDADLIGGYVLRIGDQQIDYSVKNALQKMKLKLL